MGSALAATFYENDGESALLPVAEFDSLPSFEAAGVARQCCSSRRWVSQVVAGRPYGSVRRLIGASDDVIADLAWSDLAEALATCPRVADLVAGAPSAITSAVLRAAGAYEQRFGHPLLVRAAGRRPEDVLAAVQRRLDNPTTVERDVVRGELRDSVRMALVCSFR